MDTTIREGEGWHRFRDTDGRWSYFNLTKGAVQNYKPKSMEVFELATAAGWPLEDKFALHINKMQREISLSLDGKPIGKMDVRVLSGNYSADGSMVLPFEFIATIQSRQPLTMEFDVHAMSPFRMSLPREAKEYKSNPQDYLFCHKQLDVGIGTRMRAEFTGDGQFKAVTIHILLSVRGIGVGEFSGDILL